MSMQVYDIGDRSHHIFPAVSRLVDCSFKLPALATSHAFEQPAFKEVKAH
jgi:hypothetical protein